MTNNDMLEGSQEPSSETANAALRKQQILDTLDSFVNQRPGLDPRDYGGGIEGWRLYRSEARSITKDMHDYYAIRGQIAWRDSITADMLIEAFERAFSGRLSIEEKPVQNAGYYGVNATFFTLHYTAGQYMPTEYRKAACAVLASAWWKVTRADCPDLETDDAGDFAGWNPGQWMRLQAKKTFSKSVRLGYFH